MDLSPPSRGFLAPDAQDSWTDPRFHDQVVAWADQQGVAPTGELSQPHARPWSSAIRLGTAEGPVWFKVNGPGTAHEPALVAVLSRLVPDLVPDLLATDTVRGWSLTRDAGPTMRSTAPADELWGAWEQVARRYAEAQLELASAVPELLAAGVRDLTPRALPSMARALLDRLALLGEEEGGLTEDETERLRARLPAYDDLCAELAGSAVPISLQHDDLHSNNICWSGSAESARIIDWGDASVAHPFGTMLCTLNSVAHHSGRPLDDPRVLRVRDAYLEPFQEYAGHRSLVRQVELARRTGCVSRALSWEAGLLGQPAAVHAAEEFPVREWFLDLLEV